MSSARWIATAATVGLLATGAGPAAAQWTIGAGIRTPRFAGGAVEPSTGRELRPYRPTVLELSLERAAGRLGFGLRLHYASSSLALEGPDALAAVKDAISVYGVDPEVSLHLATVGADGRLRLHAGPLLELWKLPDVGSHTRLGMAGSIGLEVPFGRTISGTARLGVGVTASPFAREDLEASLEPRTLWRREGVVGLKLRL